MAIKITDHGADALLKRAKRLSKASTVRVGVMGNKATEEKINRDGGGEGLTVVQVAETHEFGIGVPRRSFIRDYHDQNQAAIKKRLEKAAGTIWKAKNQGGVKRELYRVGEYLVDGIVTRIENGIPPENSKETKERKGSSTPLIDTGQLKSSIDYEVDA